MCLVSLEDGFKNLKSLCHGVRDLRLRQGKVKAAKIDVSLSPSSPIFLPSSFVLRCRLLCISPINNWTGLVVSLRKTAILWWPGLGAPRFRFVIFHVGRMAMRNWAGFYTSDEFWLLSSKSPKCEATYLSVVITGSAAFILVSHIPPARRTILVRCEKFCTKKDPGSEPGLSNFWRAQG